MSVRNLLHIVFCLDNSGVGGTELNAVRTAERLVERGHTVEVASLARHPYLTARYERAGIPVHVFPMPSLASAAAIRQGFRLWRFLRVRGADVLHAHDPYGNMFGVPWARLARVPVVLASRRWWTVEVRSGHRTGNRLAYRLAHGVVANSPRVAELVRREAGRRAHVAVVPNFLDESAFRELQPLMRRDLEAELDIPVDRAVIGCVAGLRPIKDHATLLRALAQLNDGEQGAHLILVGDGELRGSLSRLARELDIDGRISFAGHRDHQPNLHRLFDISVLTSRAEGLSNSLLEAMAAGNPVVATRVGGTPDVVSDGETGLLVPPENPSAVVAALKRLLDDPGLAKRMGERGRELARDRFGAEKAIQILCGVYAELRAQNPAVESDRLDVEPDRDSGVTPQLPAS